MGNAEMRSPHTLFLEHLLNGNKPDASRIIHDLVKENTSIKSIYEKVIKPALYQVGDFWEQNWITVAEEHTATSITESIMNELYPSIIAGAKGFPGKVVVGCVEGEMHQVGAKMVADMFELRGWDTWFPGANIPTSELVRYIQKIEPDVTALSASIYFHLPALENMILEIRAVFPDMPLLIGGQAFRHGGREIISRFNRLTFISDLEELEIYINSYPHENTRPD